MKYNIALIGAGELGSRHLQGLANASNQFQISVIDPNKNSLRVAKNRLNEASKLSIPKVSYYDSIDSLPEAIDLVIIATNAKVRRDIIKNLIDKSSIKYLILEKVVFQRSNDFNLIKNLLNEKNVKTWVNCARRSFAFCSSVWDAS